jgi:hypothetical protein
VAIARDDDGHYLVSAGNLAVDWKTAAPGAQHRGHRRPRQGPAQGRLRNLLRRPRDAEASGGAGLGLLDIARKWHRCSLPPEQPDGRAFFWPARVI